MISFIYWTAEILSALRGGSVWRKQSFFPCASVIGWAFLHSWTGRVIVFSDAHFLLEKWRPFIDHFNTKTYCKDKKNVLEPKNSAKNQPKLSANLCSWVQTCSQQIKERLTDTKVVRIVTQKRATRKSHTWHIPLFLICSVVTQTIPILLVSSSFSMAKSLLTPLAFHHNSIKKNVCSNISMEASKLMTVHNCFNNLKWNHDFFFFTSAHTLKKKIF